MTEKETDLQAAPEDEVQQETLQEELQEETDAPLDDEEEAEEDTKPHKRPIWGCFVSGLRKKRWHWGGGGIVWDARFPCGSHLRGYLLLLRELGKGEA